MSLSYVEILDESIKRIESGPSIVVHHDETLDVLRVRLANDTIVRAKAAPSDGHLILELNREGNVVGIEMLDTNMRPAFWEQHPDQALIPASISSGVKAFLESRVGKL